MQSKNELKSNIAALKTIIIYMIFGGLWIFFSDSLLYNLVKDQALIYHIATIKGWLFILSTATILYFLIRRYTGTIQASMHEIDTLVKHVNNLTKYANDIILLLNEDERIIDVNDRALESYGYLKYEILKLKNKDLCLENKGDLFGRTESTSALPADNVFETTQVRKNGTTFFAEVNTRRINVGGNNYYQCIIKNIDEKKEAEKSILESHMNFKELADLLPQVVFEADLNGILTFGNRSGHQMFGVTEDDIKKQLCIFDYILPDDQNRIKERFSRLIKTGKAEDGQYIAIRSDGSKFPCIIFSNLVIRDGKTVGIRGLLIDISEQKSIEDELRKSEEKYRTLVETANDAIFIADVETGIIIDANLMAEKLLGKTKAEIIGIHQSQLHPPEEAEIYKNNFRRDSNGPKLFHEETYVKHADGHLIPVEISHSTGTLGNKKIMQGIFRDITERKQAEEQIKILSMAIEQSPTSVIMTDTSGSIEYVNSKFTQLTGYTLEEVIGKNPRILKSGETPIEVYKQLWQSITSGNEWHGELHNKKKDGTFYWEFVSISPIRDNKGNINHYLAVREDVTLKKLMTEELILAKEKAEESDRLKSEFLAQMSHEIRTPLNTILSYNYLLKEELEESSKEYYSKMFNSIDSASKRLLRTIDLILNMSAIHTGMLQANLSNVNLSEVLNKLITEFDSTAKSRNLKLSFEFLLKDSILKSDSNLLTDIFQNLIDNALKYTNEGEIKITAYKNDSGQICVDVKDTGIGIAKEYLPKLFQPFTQEQTGYSRKYEGNGLGLALVKKYSELLGSEILVKSEKEKGTTFTIVFKN
jgi:PAS domain S-box-containing protein